MKILILAAQPPSIFSGGEIRLNAFVKHLSRHHDVTVVFPLYEEQKYLLDSPAANCKLIPIWLEKTEQKRRKTYYSINAWRQELFGKKPQLAKEFYSPKIQKQFSKILRSQRWDIVQAQQLLMSQYIPDKLRIPTVLDLDNLWSILYSPQASPTNGKKLTEKFLHWLDYKKILAYEEEEIRRFSSCLAISRYDQAEIQSFSHNKPVKLIPYGVDDVWFTQVEAQHSHNNTILFAGSLSWPANIDAVTFFAGQIFPAIRNQRPDARFQIVGREVPEHVLSLQKEPNIEVVESVADIRSHLAACTIFTVPVRAGAGSRPEILEAMACGKAVLSTTIGADGLNYRHQEDILIADTAQEMITGALALLENAGLRDQIGRNAQTLVKNQNNWESIVASLDQLYISLTTNG